MINEFTCLNLSRHEANPHGKPDAENVCKDRFRRIVYWKKKTVSGSCVYNIKSLWNTKGVIYPWYYFLYVHYFKVANYNK